jgi:hypothetical protein
VQTFIRTPQDVFANQQRLVVPLFQRPYVWNEELQWKPLWDDLTRVAEQLITGEPLTHFIGAVVIQESRAAFGQLPHWTIIDGQQRLTTLQLLLDALRVEVAGQHEKAAERLESLIFNSEAFLEQAEDRFKVWPTNRDRAMFAYLLGGQGERPEEGERLAQAHEFFRKAAAEWIADGSDAARRSLALETAIRSNFQMVVIQLGADDDAQEIFETLNARGTPLTAADLVKNFVFSRLADEGAPIEQTYEQHWRRFETGFWETELSVGRNKMVRSSLFLNHWLVANTGEEVRSREVFYTFKRETMGSGRPPMLETVRRLDRAAQRYEDFSRAAETVESDIDRIALFAYRLNVLEIDVFRPIVLALLDQELDPIPADQLGKSIEVVESFLVRRALLKLTGQSYSQIAPRLCTLVRGDDRVGAGDALEEYFSGETSQATYWPGDEELIRRLVDEPLYHRIAGRRIRMVLEAVEDDLRGWSNASAGLGGQRVPRGRFTIEHVMPQQWRRHWEQPKGKATPEQRDQLVQRLGNLTLVTSRLNSKLSNAAWETKHAELSHHDVLHLNRSVLGKKARWTEQNIADRSQMLAERIAAIWSVPEGHSPVNLGRPVEGAQEVSVADLIVADLIRPGTVLHVSAKKFRGRTAIVLPDGRLEVDGVAYDTPSGAGRAIRGRNTNGWWFWRTDVEGRDKLSELRRLYAASLGEDVDDDTDDELEGENGDDE